MIFLKMLGTDSRAIHGGHFSITTVEIITKIDSFLLLTKHYKQSYMKFYNNLFSITLIKVDEFGPSKFCVLYINADSIQQQQCSLFFEKESPSKFAVFQELKFFFQLQFDYWLFIKQMFISVETIINHHGSTGQVFHSSMETLYQCTSTIQVFSGGLSQTDS